MTKPCVGMRKAMAEAVVGDDVFGDDPTVLELQDKVAKLLNKEAGLFVPIPTFPSAKIRIASVVPLTLNAINPDSRLIKYESLPY